MKIYFNGCLFIYVEYNNANIQNIPEKHDQRIYVCKSYTLRRQDPHKF